MVTRNPAASELSKVAMLGTQSSEKSRLGRTCQCIYILPLFLPHGFSAITTMWIFKLQAQVVHTRGSFRRSHQDVTKYVSEVSGFLRTSECWFRPFSGKVWGFHQFYPV